MAHDSTPTLEDTETHTRAHTVMTFARARSTRLTSRQRCSHSTKSKRRVLRRREVLWKTNASTARSLWRAPWETSGDASLCLMHCAHAKPARRIGIQHEHEQAKKRVLWRRHWCATLLHTFSIFGILHTQTRALYHADKAVVCGLRTGKSKALMSTTLVMHQHV
jgi:hypothetical protein